MQIDSIEELAGFGMGVARLIVRADDLRKERDTLRDALQGMVDSYEHEASASNPALLSAREALGCGVIQVEPVAIPAEAAVIGAALDSESLEQGEPA